MRNFAGWIFAVGLSAVASTGQAEFAQHCAAALAKNKVIKVKDPSGKTVRFEQISMTRCTCDLQVMSKYLPDDLITHMMDNHMQGRMLAVGSPDAKSLSDDIWVTKFFNQPRRKRKKMNAELSAKCGRGLPKPIG